MSVNARQALEHLVSALNAHFEAVVERRGPDDAAVDDAYEALANAFERYEYVMDKDFDESLPLVIDDSDDFDDTGSGDSDDDDDDDLDDLDDDDDDDDDAGILGAGDLADLDTFTLDDEDDED